MAQQYRNYGSPSSNPEYQRGRGGSRPGPGGFGAVQNTDHSWDDETSPQSDWSGEQSFGDNSRSPYDARDYGRSETGYGRPQRGQFRGGSEDFGSNPGGRYGAGGDYYSEPPASESWGHQPSRSQGRDRGYVRQQYGQYGSGNSGQGFGQSYSHSFGQSQQPGSMGHRGKGPKGYQRSDERLKEVICERLTDDDSIDASNFSITVKNGEVTLEGTVRDRQARHLAEDLVESCGGIKEIHNNLRVERGEESSSRSSVSASENGSSTGTSARGSGSRSN